MKTGTDCLCCGDWSVGETQALALYGALLQPTETPQVFAQIGQSLDGRVATETGDAQDISGQDGLAHLHRLRALADAVVIGVKTALHDDPQLTVRLADGTSPARVVIDPDGRLPNDARLLTCTDARRIIIQATDTKRPAGVEVITLPRAPWIAPDDILAALKKLGFRRILIEGGGITIAQFLEAGLLDRLHVAVAPLLIGSGPQSLTTSPVGTLAAARRPQTDIYNLGSDILFDCALAPASCTAADAQHRITHSAPTAPAARPRHTH
ncbi:RibD family protein [Yoonia sp. BS5-3]|uniref:RibD family protein n=1 Tax=Yoonia phaeophyticola TaxID=3137369 RepID=A0ABZ2V6J2_9RHOB